MPKAKGDVGKVISVKGNIVEVEFDDGVPEVYQMLQLMEDPEVKLSVYSSSGSKRFYCLVLAGAGGLYRGARVKDTGEIMSVPVGEELLGRLIDVFGEPADGGPPIKTKSRRQVQGTVSD